MCQCVQWAEDHYEIDLNAAIIVRKISQVRHLTMQLLVTIKYQLINDILRHTNNGGAFLF